MRALSRLVAGFVLAVPWALDGQGAPDATLAIGQAVSAHYDSAFAELLARAESDGAAFGWLVELARFKRQRVGWAVERDGRLRAVTPARMDAWLVVVPRDDPAYERMGSLLESDPGATVRATRVKADTIAPAWAAIFLAFELSHIRDDVLGLLPTEPRPSQLAASSRRAYVAEYLAVRLRGGRAVDAHLDSVLATAAPPSIIALAEGILPILRESFAGFDALVTTQAPLTEREGQRRGGVYAATLLLRFAEQHALSDEAVGAALRCIGGCR